MFVKCSQIVKWKEARGPVMEMACALCGKKIRAGDKCLSAIWRAQGGRYVQAYHVECGKVVKLWGYPNEFLSPKQAETWAYGLSCSACPDRLKCMMYVFECRRAMDAIKLLGGSARASDEPQASDEPKSAGTDTRIRTDLPERHEGWRLNRNGEGIADRKYKEYYDRKASGLCVSCGKPTEDARCQCAACRAKKQDYDKTRKRGKK